MYLSKDGRRIFDCPTYGPHSFDSPISSDLLHPNIFEVDPLMVPLISILRSRGYPTLNCCQGHIYTHLSIEPEDVDSYADQHPRKRIIPISKAKKEPNFTTPYIMFAYPSSISDASTLLAPFQELCSSSIKWDLEITHVRPLSDINNPDSKYDSPVYYNDKIIEEGEPFPVPGFCIRYSYEIMMEFLGLNPTEKSLAKLSKDFGLYYRFNSIIARELKFLCFWAQELPEIKKW